MLFFFMCYMPSANDEEAPYLKANEVVQLTAALEPTGQEVLCAVLVLDLHHAAGIDRYFIERR